MDLINQALKELNKGFKNLSTEEILRRKKEIQRHLNFYNIHKNKNRKNKVLITLVFKTGI